MFQVLEVVLAQEILVGNIHLLIHGCQLLVRERPAIGLCLLHPLDRGFPGPKRDFKGGRPGRNGPVQPDGMLQR
jgi:hypothetical protein